MKLDWRIRNKLIGGFSIVLILLATVAGYSIISSKDIENQAHFMSETSAMNIDIVEKLRVSAIQVQQFLTDASLTNDEGALNEAEKWAGEYRKHMGEMHQKCSVCHARVFKNETKYKAEVDACRKELSEDFDKFYELGRKMALVYIKEGRESGNRVMKDFDGAAQRIHKILDERTKMAERHFKRSWDKVNNTVDRSTKISLFGSILAIVIGVALALAMATKIENPIKGVVDMAERIANGNLTGDDINVKSKDEIGSLASSLNKMKKSLNEMMGRIVSTANQVASASEELSATVRQIKTRVDDQAGRSGQVATSAAEMSQTVIDVAKNASNIASSSNDTLKIAENGEDVVRKTVNEVQETARSVSDLSRVIASLGERSKQIGDIAAVIKDIADQTNLLALNAAIEAARAGEQGRGFAVVADEVRKLAERTAKATTEIDGMIKAMQDETERAVHSMEESLKRVELGASLSTQAGGALRKILESVHGLQSMVQQIASATEEMSTVSEHISSDIEAVADVSKETSANAAEIEKASDSLAKLSEDLRGVVDRFKI